MCLCLFSTQNLGVSGCMHSKRTENNNLFLFQLGGSRFLLSKLVILCHLKVAEKSELVSIIAVNNIYSMAKKGFWFSTLSIWKFLQVIH